MADADIDSLFSNFVNSVKEVANNLGMLHVRNNRIGFSKVWFDAECLNKRKFLKTMLKECRLLNFPPELTKDYNNYKTSYVNLLEKKKKDYNDYRIGILASAIDSTSFWKIVNKSRRKANIPNSLDLKS